MNPSGYNNSNPEATNNEVGTGSMIELDDEVGLVGSVIDMDEWDVSSEFNQKEIVSYPDERYSTITKYDEAAANNITQQQNTLHDINAVTAENVTVEVTQVAHTEPDVTYKDQVGVRRGEQIRSNTSRHDGNSNVLISPSTHEINTNDRRENVIASNPGAAYVSRRRELLTTNPSTSNNNTTIDIIIGENEYVNSIPLAAVVYEESNNVPIAYATVLRQYSFKKIVILVSGILCLIIAVVVTMTVFITKRHVKSTGSIQGSVPNSPTPAVITPTAAPTSSQHIGTSENLVIAIDKYLSGGDNQTEVINQYGLIKDWDVTNIESFSGLFSSNRNMMATNFSEDLSNWDVSDVSDMESMFSGALNFYGNISGWNVSSVTNMTNMFNSAGRFDGDLSLWDVSSVTTMEGMFAYATVFSGKGIGRWQTNRVSTMKHMFQYATSFNANLSGWDVTSLQDGEGMFDNADSYEGIGINEWNTSAIESMTGMFFQTKTFNANLSKWNTGNVKFMNSMFYGASKFQGIGIDNWDTKYVEDMRSMFQDATLFDADVSRWNISRVTFLSYMLANTAFRGIGIDAWNTSSVEYMDCMFRGTTHFDANLANWDTSKVTLTSEMFRDSKFFIGIGLENWNTSQIVDMDRMFEGAESFNANLSRWDVSNVQTMQSMFENAKSFRGAGLETWNVWSVNNTALMFQDAVLFDANLSKWDIASIDNMTCMFDNATSFRGVNWMDVAICQ